MTSAKRIALGVTLLAALVACSSPNDDTAGKNAEIDQGARTGVPVDPVASVDECADGKRNGSETDVDCGGNCAAKCAPHRACATAADCTSARV